MSNGAGGTSTTTVPETYWERVNTWANSENYRYVEWADTSPDKSSLDYVSMLALTRLRFYERYEFSTRAAASFEY